MNRGEERAILVDDRFLTFLQGTEPTHEVVAGAASLGADVKHLILLELRSCAVSATQRLALFYQVVVLRLRAASTIILARIYDHRATHWALQRYSIVVSAQVELQHPLLFLDLLELCSYGAQTAVLFLLLVGIVLATALVARGLQILATLHVVLYVIVVE